AVLEELGLLVGEAARPFQSLHRQQRVPLAHLGDAAAVQKLQELDGELDVADAAAAGLDVVVAAAGAAGLLLDAPLQRLDLVDLAEAQVLAVDERLDVPDEAFAELQVAGDRAPLDGGL